MPLASWSLKTVPVTAPVVLQYVAAAIAATATGKQVRPAVAIEIGNQIQVRVPKRDRFRSLGNFAVPQALKESCSARGIVRDDVWKSISIKIGQCKIA